MCLPGTHELVRDQLEAEGEPRSRNAAGRLWWAL